MILGPIVQIAAFALFTFIAIAGALGMATTMSMFRSGIFLMGSFIGAAGLFIMLSADLIGFLQIMMYIGGMLVMILFMVLFMHDPGGAMMAGMDMSLIERLFSRGIPPMPMDHSGMQHGEMDHSQMQHGAMDHGGDGGMPMDHSQMDHSQMDHSQMDHSQMQHGEMKMDHSQMDHSQMQHGAMDHGGEDGGMKMDHSQMDHSQMQHGAMDHGSEDGGMKMDHSQMDHSQMQHGSGGDGGAMDMGGMHMSGMHHGGMDMGSMDMSMTTPIKRPAAILAVVVGVLLVALLILRPAWPASAAVPNPNSAEQVGQLLMGKYMLAFEGAGLLILIGIFGAVFLARPGQFPDQSDRAARVAHDEKPVPAEAAPLLPILPGAAPDEDELESVVGAHFLDE